MQRIRLVSTCLLFVAAGLFLQNASALAEEAAQQRDQRMGWWRDARFGMFIHFGLYSHAAGYWDGKPVPGLASWTLHTTKAPLEQYIPLKDQFNPTQFDADEIVRLAKAAGMKYIVITTRHHEGFSLFETEYSDFDVMATPLKRDLMKEMAEACRKHDMPLGWYYSILDWYHPDYTPRRPGDDRPTEGADYDRYVRFMKDQLRELVTKYGKIDILWFDGSWDPTFTNERGLDLYKYVLSLQPTIVINNRLGHGDDRPGDFGTPEQTIPVINPDGKDWETCMTINDTWGFKRQDHNWKSAETMIRMLADCASKGGNFLLNIGPAPDGTIPRSSVERLEEMGRWMAVNGESVYGTKAGPYRRRLPWGCVSRKNLDNGRVRLFVHVFDWPKEGELVIPRIANKPLAAYLLADPAKTPLPASQNTIDGERVIVVRTGPRPPSEHDSVVVLDVEGEPEVTFHRIKPAADGKLALLAVDADLNGRVLRYDGAPGRESIGHWTRAKDWISWPVDIKKLGTYQVEITYGCAPESGGGTYRVEVAGKRLEAKTLATKGWFDRRTDVVGRITIEQTGDQTVALRCLKIDEGRAAALDFQKLVLKPVEGDAIAK
ncbi:MAG TPA: alpha-L-fucosidase [Planctomycetaceae bacterium]|nr:alpha-L-fucosidase [Planctomycetaceae bacterium]